ncbi:hypothetical protein DR64_7768 [Paraburkholderia xenovorans LB400]|uniref:hypothetical protein n=1 Tax=Paraburkholderia xenovorans TaxID=36873 RepID=UPI0004F79704|nr:hypothetical protein [Paraburkholderia xenovorans]AIP34231.1 hypothetical protein DR64_7768 [Paraburkholderia xenovorans LB400]
MLGKVIGTWQGRRRLERLPRITVDTTANYYKAFTAPKSDLVDALLLVRLITDRVNGMQQAQADHSARFSVH